MIELLSVTAASSLLALADLKASEDKWVGALQIDASSASGNTNNTVLGGRLNLARKFGPITHAFEAGGNYAESTITRDGEEVTETTQNRYFTQYRIEVQTGDRTFLYGRARYDEDQFSGFDRQVFVGGGLGHTLAKSDTRELTVLVGPGYQYQERTRTAQSDPDQERIQSTVAVFLGQTYKQVIRENVTFEESLDATVSDGNDTVKATFSLKTKLTDSISSRISYNVIHNTEPPEGREQTDTLLSASIGYEF